MAVTAAHIVSALRRAYPHPDYGFATEVGQATGFKARRHLDVVIMDTWPSRGLELMGVEIKVSAGDLARELAQPEKSEEIARFCNSFWLATPKGLVKDAGKLPFSWGLLEVEEDGSVCHRIRARRKDGEPVSKEFVAALLRGARRGQDENELAAEVAAKMTQWREEHERDFERRVQAATGNNDSDAREHRQLREKLGDRYRLLSNEQVIRAMKVVMDAGLHDSWGGIQSLGYTLLHACEQVDKALVDAGLEAATFLKRPKGRR